MGLSPYSMILLAAGGEERIENIAPGAAVREALAGQILNVVNCLNSPGVGMMRVQVEGGIILDLTGDQNLLTNSGMIEAQRLAPGDGVRVRDGFARCVSVERLMGDYMVYDLVVEASPNDEPWIVANGLVVNAQL